MRYPIAVLLTGLIISLLLFGFDHPGKRSVDLPQKDFALPSTGDETVGCAPEKRDLSYFEETGHYILPLPGWGNYHWKINTSNDSTQFYFNQGLNLFYSFHIEEARESFKEAERRDPNCAMAYWGEIMAAGPTINSPAYNFSDTSLIAGLQKGISVANDPLEKLLLEAQAERFNKNEEMDLKERAIAYSKALKQIQEHYPDNIEVSLLYADALMQVNARNWYEVDGRAKPGTDSIVTLLESIIAKSAYHPAALHYYVHIMEASQHPEKALDEADKLMGLLPSVAHMVHMPSHIYIRTGYYEKGILSNKLAIAGYRQYQQVLKGFEGSRTLYFYHNADMQGTNAMMMGNYRLARQSFAQNKESFNLKDTSMFATPGGGTYFQFLTIQPYLLDIRFGKWQDILQVQAPQSDFIYHKLLWQFGQGMAYAKTGDAAAARQSLSAINEAMKDTLLLKRRGNRNRGIDGAIIAANILQGTIYHADKNYQEAIRFFAAAVQAEDSLRYSEPEDWRIPSRHFLGEALIDAGDYNKAQEIFAADLADHPSNFWAINGLKLLLSKQHKRSALRSHLKKYKKEFSLADAKLNGSVF